MSRARERRRRAALRAASPARARRQRGARGARAGRASATGSSTQPDEALGRRAAARRDRARAASGGRRSCSPTSRPATSTRRSGDEILALLRELNAEGTTMRRDHPRPRDRRRHCRAADRDARRAASSTTRRLGVSARERARAEPAAPGRRPAGRHASALRTRRLRAALSALGDRDRRSRRWSPCSGSPSVEQGRPARRELDRLGTNLLQVDRRAGASSATTRPLPDAARRR